MEITINGNLTIGTKVDVAAGATYIHTRIDHVDNYHYSESADTVQRIPNHQEMKEGLAKYFGVAFKGRNPLKLDYLDMLVNDIKEFDLPKDHARIANMLYCSKEMVNKPRNFTAWLKEYCRICGIVRVRYDQSKVEDFDLLKKRFYCLTF